ncbi:MAG: hypothetical protein LBU48_01735, partial [Coriobacteriales bacterium]|nr:hypothetical protein [Coriobacteriales bacterium]
MQEKLTAFIEKRMHGRSFKDNDEVYLFLVLIVAVGFAGVVHAVLFFSFIAIDILPMVGVNAVSVTIYLLALFFTFRRHYTAAGLMVSLEIVCFAVLSQLLIGFYSYLIFFYFLVLILQLIIPYGSPWLRIGIVVLMVVLLFLQVVFEPDYVEPYPLGEHHLAFSYFNIALTFVATVVEFFIGTYVRSSIARGVEARTLELETQA